MSLKEFINDFVECNTLIRLWRKIPEDGSYEELIKYDKPMMEHELIKSKYKNCFVVGVTDILYVKSEYVEAVNLVIDIDLNKLW